MADPKALAFQVIDDPRPGLTEGRCTACGWQPMVAMPRDETIARLVEHYRENHIEALPGGHA